MLRGSELRHIREALMASFDVNGIRLLLSDRLDRRLDDCVASNTSGEEIFFQLVDHANRHGWLPELLAAAHHERPRSTALTLAARQMSGGVQPPHPPEGTET